MATTGSSITQMTTAGLSSASLRVAIYGSSPDLRGCQRTKCRNFSPVRRRLVTIRRCCFARSRPRPTGTRTRSRTSPPRTDVRRTAAFHPLLPIPARRSDQPPSTLSGHSAHRIENRPELGSSAIRCAHRCCPQRCAVMTAGLSSAIVCFLSNSGSGLLV
jgi:hypothetical protein